MSQDPHADAPWLIVGLGNPGPRFVGTRHNAGFMALDELSRRRGIRFSGKQANAEIGRGNIAGSAAILAKPLTYMNNSGRAVGALARYYKVPLERLLVVYDDIALPLGTIRSRAKGSAGGHNGVTSVIQHLGTQNFPRVRIGVDRPVNADYSQVNWVLNRFTRDEAKVMAETLPLAAEAIEAVLQNGIERAMNAYNSIGAGDRGSGVGVSDETATSDPKPPASDKGSPIPDPRPPIPGEAK
jgi:peptidyl-tRNA hydrolase, PTH1 family